MIAKGRGHLVDVGEIGAELRLALEVAQHLRLLDGVDSAELAGNALRVSMQDLTDTAPRVLAFLRQYGVRYSYVSTERADLETVFLALTGRSVRNA